MKLLVYSHSFAPNVGGIETIVSSLCRGLAELVRPGGGREFEITLVTQTGRGEFNDGALPFQVIRRPGSLLLWKLIRGTDTVHLANPALLPLVLARICGKPVVIEHHGYQAVCPNGLLLRQPDGSVCPGHFLAGQYARCARCLRDESSFWRSWFRVLLMFPRHALAKRASANVAISHHFVSRCRLPQSVVIYHGIEPVAPSPLRSRPAGEQPLRFAYIGRLVREKGMAVLSEAMRLVLSEGQPAEFLVIGDGPERQALQSVTSCKNFRNSVRMTGFLTGSALAQAASTVDAALMPSIWEETAGLAAIEQMMRGKLVIASDIGGLGEIVGEAGLKFAAGDAQALAGAMRTVIEQSSLIDSLGEKATARAHALFQRDRMIAEHAELYRRLLARSPD